MTKARDVVNADPADRTLVPSGISPNAAVMCIYSGQLNPSTKHLAISLNATEAAQTAASLQQVSLKRPTGTVNCPEDSGSFAILAFSYPRHRDVDLWWDTTGCQTIDNGRIGASQIASDSFAHFQETLDSAAKLPNGPYLLNP
ncbi:hypothetical protein AX769_05660 [Frondihabitans sp. PAMC 28766]|uniref:hypothetical protein n=1 Tax=Frondihabitans sp. PAMC 28766 TaxID=1795630 RepID=UPI00078BD6C0|nr:hypothetical protein [Frondihabitans sp. PAMC 28766]AMM19725.1 hypothetical protein AX769_05660 [Frondihabitans sp. PAMC 28766]